MPAFLLPELDGATDTAEDAEFLFPEEAVPEEFVPAAPEDVPVEPEADAVPVEAVFPEDALFLFALPVLPAAEEASVFTEATAVEEEAEPPALLPAEVPLPLAEDVFVEGVLLTTVFTVFGAEDSLRPDELLAAVLPAEEAPAEGLLADVLPEALSFFKAWIPVPEDEDADDEFEEEGLMIIPL